MSTRRALRSAKRPASPSSSPLSSPPPSPKRRKTASEATKSRKLAQLEQFASNSPFPSHPTPTAADCTEVTRILADVHGMPQRSFKDPVDYGGCGNVPNVLDALVRTILSQNTTSANSTRAHRSLVEKFKYPPACWENILASPVETLVEAIRCGGLAQRKATVIHKVLKEVKERYGVLSLDHLHSKTDKDVMEELVGFDGIGPKTASCVLLFCMQRSSFAVDTHVFRLTKALGWIPPNATREQAFHHLDARIPDDLKYPLHVLLIQHGKSCPNCAANGRPGMGGWKAAALKTPNSASNSPVLLTDEQKFKETIKEEEEDDAGHPRVKEEPGHDTSRPTTPPTKEKGKKSAKSILVGVCPLKANHLLSSASSTRPSSSKATAKSRKAKEEDTSDEVVAGGAGMVIKAKEELEEV